jgi:hypothetical protein
MLMIEIHEEPAPPEAQRYYRAVLRALQDDGVPFLVGGAYAFARYTGIVRHTKDFDLFLRPEARDPALQVLQRAGFRTEITSPHWLAKAFSGEYFVDLIYSSGNGVCRVDEAWFEYAEMDEVMGMQVALIPPEEMIWSKGFVMARERYDNADIHHVLLARGDSLDWTRLVHRFGPYWRVLFAHLVLFGFAYPGERDRIPRPVMDELLARMRLETETAPPRDRICQGTLLTQTEYRTDVERWGFYDARLDHMGSPEAIDREVQRVKEAMGD